MYIVSVTHKGVSKPKTTSKIIALLFFLCFSSYSQTDTTVKLTFDFNDHQIKENNNKIIPKPVGVDLTYDRFGNKESAVHIMGDNQSYLNLGTSKLLKSPNMSISLWVKINNRVYVGKGYENIPIVTTKNGPGDDFINAICIAYDIDSKHLTANSTKDSEEEVIIDDNDSIVFNKWYHLVTICNNRYLAFYIDGELIGRSPKKFETKFLETDSFMIGHSASLKNKHFMRGVVDDIRIFHKALSQQEVLALYNAPNPNEFKNFLDEALKYVLIIVMLGIIIFILVIRNRRLLRKQKEELELAAKIAELELKAVRAQMNPHFISNSLAAIQDLNYNHDVEKAGLYIAKFSYFLRQVLNYSDENYITMSDEVTMIRLYLELEQLRFKNGFKFDVFIDDAVNTADIMLPSLITQPFIENAIWHGLLPLKNSRDPHLVIRILIREGLPVIEVEDNGIGRDLSGKIKKNSKGTQLMMDKMDALNRLSNTSNYKISIIDLTDSDGNKLGTKIIINLDNLKE